MFLKLRDWLGLIITCHLCYRFFPDQLIVAVVLGIVLHTVLWVFVHNHIQARVMLKSGRYKVVHYE